MRHVLALLVTAVGVAAIAHPAPEARGLVGGSPTAIQVLLKLKKAGLPIGEYRVYGAATDPNKLLGRPGQYTSKVNFNDKRLKASAGFDVSGGGSVEVFASAADAKRRHEYVVALAKSPLFSEYDYLKDKFLLRVSSDLTPLQAKQYDAALAGRKVPRSQVSPAQTSRIVVLGSGVTPSKILDAYGAVLRNTSKLDATDVSIQGNLIDSAKTIVSGVTPIIPVIPAGATYYWGGSVPHKSGTHAAKFEVRVTTADFVGSGAKLPLVTKVKLGSDGYNMLVTGRVKNTVGFTLSQIATINAVFLKSSGRVLGGASGFLDSDLPRGRTALFEINAFRIITRKQIARVRVSMDAQRVP